jgi:transposase
MSLQPQIVYLVPEDTARIARAAFPKGNVYMRMRDSLGMIYDDPTFAKLFPPQGRPAESPFRLALTLVMQFAENLSDAQAADAVRGRLDWKYALGLDLTDPGFDASVLSEFRSRLIAGGMEQVLLDTMLTLFRDQGLLKPRGKQRTDSTHVLAAIHALNRLECVGETLRHALNSLAVVAPAWLRTQVTPDWFDRYGSRVDNYRLPKTDTERQALAEVIGVDGFQLLRAIFHPETPPWLREVPAVDILRQVWMQQFYAPERQVRWRVAEDLPPGAVLINSPYDPEARFSVKRDITWTGYKAHVTETCDPDSPHLIVNIATTLATTGDVETTEGIHAALAAKDLLPSEHIVDAGYIDAELLVTSGPDYGIELCGPVHEDNSWQAAAQQGFDAGRFAIDWEAQTVTCPQGTHSKGWKPTHDRHGNPVVYITFAREDCLACPVRTACTRSKTSGRSLTVRPQVQHEAIQAARAHQKTPEFKQAYAVRAGVEGTLSQGVALSGLRRSRYIGCARTHLQHIITAAALNLVRVMDWLAEVPRAGTRTSRFAALAAGSV